MKTQFIVLACAMTLAGVTLPLQADQLVGGEPSQRDQDVARSHQLPRLGHLQRADKIIGARIKDDEGKSLGKVEDLALDMANGRIVEVIVGSGGFLGIDRNTIAIPPECFSWDSAMTELQLSIGRDQIKGVPEFSLSHWTEAADLSQIKEVYQRFGVDPYFKDSQTPSAGNRDANAQSGQVGRYYSFNGDNALPDLGHISQASKLLDTTVCNMTNEKLARVENFMVDLPAGRCVEVVLGTGDYMRPGDEMTAVPPQSFHWNADKTALTFDTSQAALKGAPHFKPAEYDLATTTPSVREVYARYHVEPYFATTDIDNGAQNVRERSDSPVTTLEHGNNADLKITDQIHQAVLARENLSVDAKDVKIVTVDGTVTLIGSVASEDEKHQIAELAAKFVAADKIDNQLQIRGTSTQPAIMSPTYGP